MTFKKIRCYILVHYMYIAIVHMLFFIGSRSMQ